MKDLIKKPHLEKYQVIIYLFAISLGSGFGILKPNLVDEFDRILVPLLSILLYTTFMQIPLSRLRDTLSDTCFIKLAVIANFIFIPILLWMSIYFLPKEPALRLGILMVLIVPCTDWFITFTHLGGGDTKHAIAFSPISLMLQILLLPFYLWLFLGDTFSFVIARQEMIKNFIFIILLPLILAFLTQKWINKKTERENFINTLSWLPIPLLTLVVFTIASTQINFVKNSFSILGNLFLIFAFYLFLVGILSRIIANLFRLPISQGRTLAFSLGTRNSFVVLPLAIALPSEYKLAVVTIVFQSLVELFGMIIYLWWIPKKLFPEK